METAAPACPEQVLRGLQAAGAERLAALAVVASSERPDLKTESARRLLMKIERMIAGAPSPGSPCNTLTQGDHT